jgi:two-component system, cell cycle response regulator DivK
MQHASVLVIERDADNRTMYADFLRAQGFACITAQTGEQGLRLAPMVDVIVTAIRLGGALDGLELVRRLRQQSATRDMPIIVLTALAFEPNRRRALEAGCDAFLPKPCPPEQLAITIRRTLRGWRQPRAS